MFVEYYLGSAGGNGQDAAEMAGYASPKERACALLKLPHIKARIQERISSAKLTAEQVLAILADHATASLSDFGNVVDGSFQVDLAKAKRLGRLHCIKRIRPVKVRVECTDSTPRYVVEQEIELHDAQAALEKLGRYHGLWKDKIDQSIKQEVRVVYDTDDRQFAPAAPGATEDPAPDAEIQRSLVREAVRQDEAGDQPPDPTRP